MNRFKTLPNNDVKQQYALYLAAAEAVARGNRVRVVETDRRYWLEVNGRQAQVRSRGSGTWQFGNWENPLAAETQFVTFADFIDDDEPLPKYYIAPAEWF